MRPITPNTSNSSSQPANAKIAVQLCAITFAPNPVSDIGGLMPGWKIVWNGTQTLDANYAFIAVDASGQNYVLAIRGSVPPNGIFDDWDVFANWILEDLDVVGQASWPYAGTSQPRVSIGAYLAFTNMLDMKDSLGSGLSISDYLLANNIGSEKQLIITGHSLGGNMANVYASFYVQTLINQKLSSGNVSLYTFAAPAAGNADFATDLDNKLPAAWHYQNANDLVPNFPVFDGIVFTSLLYLPQPLAAEITVTFQGHTVNLNEAFLMLAGAFLVFGYQQPANNYTIFGTALYPDYEDNTVTDWFRQAGSQHMLSNYANYLGVTLPVIPQTPFVQVV
jgi:triacylglycerol lipase